MKDWDGLTRLGRLRRLRVTADAALERHGIGGARMRLLADDTNAVYLVDAPGGRRLVLRVGRAGAIGHSVEQVRSEVAWLAALAVDAPGRAPEPVATRRGELLVRVTTPGVPETRTCVLFRWLPGTLLDRHLDETNLEAYGSLAAELHEHARRFRPPQGAGPLRWDRVFPFDEPVVLFGDVLPPGRRKLFAEAADLVTEAIGRLVAAEEMCLIHGDLHVWNVLVHRGTAAAIDFEDHMWGWPVQDLGTALYYLHGRPGYTDMAGAIRRGYERVADWPADRDLDVLVFVAARTLVLANDVALLAAGGEEEDLDVAAFFDRSERRLRAILSGTAYPG